MIRTNGKRGFTLIELMVVIGMIAIVTGSMTTAISNARHRARVQKATADVKVISQAILAYENYATDNELPTKNRVKVNRDELSFLFGTGTGTGAKGGQKHDLPVLLQGVLSGGGDLLDPWGHPYLLTIRPGGANMKTKTATGSLNTGYYLPNFYRISERER